MASFSPIRGTKTEIENTPRVDGQMLIETSEGNQNKIYIDTYDSVSGTIERTMAGGGGHQILPPMDDPNYTPNEADVVEYTNAQLPKTDKIPSLYGMQQFTNIKSYRRIMEGGTAIGGATIGSTGIGTWDEDAETVEATPVGTENPQSEGWLVFDNSTDNYIATTDTSVQPDTIYYTSVPDEDDWWQDDAFKMENRSDDIEVSIKFDPSGDTIVLGGYLLDTVTGRICIRFANSINASTARVAVDVVHQRNEYTGYVQPNLTP